MIDAIQQNPIISLIIIMAGVVPIVWKVLDVLYVKPRDFRITILEKHVEELRGELLKKPTAQYTQPVTKGIVSIPSFPVAQVPAPSPVQLDPLRSLEEMHKAWKQDGQTELQRKHFEERYTGQEVAWDVFVDSVNKSKYSISLYADARLGDVHNDYRVCAHFPLEEQTRLLEFKPGERVRLSGQIKDFFLFPKLEPAKIEKVS